MLSTIMGYYDKGKIQLFETPKVNEKTKVMVTFLEDEKEVVIIKKRIPGAFKGKISIPNDFNEPLSDLKDYM
ncbi:MAG: hypothetical protein RL708_801 [Bacteroidota bacterium]|jgi:hypothetical protein